MIGEQLSHYLIEEKLGEGGMGVVYKAQDIRLLRPVAIKILPTHLVGDKENRQRFMHEARAASALNHPNICTVHDVGQFDSTHYIVMEFVEGQTLKNMLQKRGPLQEKEVAEICMEICTALSAAHAKGIVHRDIKPDNIMLTKTGQVKVMDFGLAKLTGHEPENSSTKQSLAANSPSFDSLKTSVSSFGGTALYMAPATQIKYQTTQRSRVELTVYNLLGQKVRVLLNEVQPAGAHQTRWDGTDDSGRLVSSGAYVYRLRSADP